MFFFYRLLNEELSASELLHLLEESFEEQEDSSLVDIDASIEDADDEAESV